METPRSSLEVAPKAVDKKDIQVKKDEKVKIKVKRDVVRDIADALVNEQDGTPRGNYLVDRVILPAARKTILDVVRNLLSGVFGAVEVALYGPNAPRTGLDGPRYSRTDYSDISRERSSLYQDPIRTNAVRKFGGTVVVEAKTKESAQNTITYLRDLIAASGSASLAQLCTELGEPTNYTDTDYGWRELGPLPIDPTPTGWAVRLPRPVYLNRLNNLY